MKHLLVPIDLAHEKSWTIALSPAFELAHALGGEVTLLTVVPEIQGGLDLRYAIRGETGGFFSAELDIDALPRTRPRAPRRDRRGARGRRPELRGPRPLRRRPRGDPRRRRRARRGPDHPRRAPPPRCWKGCSARTPRAWCATRSARCRWCGKASESRGASRRRATPERSGSASFAGRSDHAVADATVVVRRLRDSGKGTRTVPRLLLRWTDGRRCRPVRNGSRARSTRPRGRRRDHAASRARFRAHRPVATGMPAASAGRNPGDRPTIAEPASPPFARLSN